VRSLNSPGAGDGVLFDIFPRRSRLLKKREILASSFDRLRMRSRVFNGLILMVSLSNHGRHHFFSILIARLEPSLT
jgi:hypothetical protein